MKKRFFAVLLTLSIIFSFSACGDSQEDTPAPDYSTSDPQPVSAENSISDKKEPENALEYEKILELFSAIIPDAELKVSVKNGKRLHVKIKTDLHSDVALDDWDNTMISFDKALSDAKEIVLNYEFEQVSAEIIAEDETILASGFNGALKFNKFEEKSLTDADTGKNRPTISKFEYDQITVGMTLSQVREIVGGDGTLENSIGTAGVTSSVQTYRFPGEKEGAYADILFEDYVVYSKHGWLLD